MGTKLPLPKGAQHPPQYSALSIVTKRSPTSAAAEHLLHNISFKKTKITANRFGNVIRLTISTLVTVCAIASGCKNTRRCVCIVAGGMSVDQVSKSCAISSVYDNYRGCKWSSVGGGGPAASSQICVCDTSECNKPGKESDVGGGESPSPRTPRRPSSTDASNAVQASSFSHVIIAVALITGVVTARLM